MTREITQTQAAFETVNRLAAGKAWVGAPVHLHPSATESYEVLEGELEVLVGGEWRTLGPGEKVSPPRQRSHRQAAAKGPAVTDAARDALLGFS